MEANSLNGDYCVNLNSLPVRKMGLFSMGQSLTLTLLVKCSSRQGSLEYLALAEVFSCHFVFIDGERERRVN